MAKLKTADILGAKAVENPAQAEDLMRFVQQAERAAMGKPSEYFSGLRAQLRDRVPFGLGTIPRFIAEAFERMAAEKGMNKREYFYHLLRKEGADIPPYEEMDGRKL